MLAREGGAPNDPRSSEALDATKRRRRHPVRIAFLVLALVVVAWLIVASTQCRSITIH